MHRMLKWDSYTIYVFIFLVFIHFYLSQQNYSKNIHESATSNLRRRVHSYSQKQFHHEKSASFLFIRPFRMQIKIYWLAFLFHIRVSFYREILEKNLELFILFFFFFSLFPVRVVSRSYYLTTINFGRSLVETDNWSVKIFS